MMANFAAHSPFHSPFFPRVDGVTLLRRFLRESSRLLGESGGNGGETSGSESNVDLSSSMLYTPTFLTATVAAIIITVSLLFERLINLIHRFLVRKKRAALVTVGHRIKDELMLVGFISIVLALIDPLIVQWCIAIPRSTIFIPCKPPSSSPAPPASESAPPASESAPAGNTAHLGLSDGRQLLSGRHGFDGRQLLGALTRGMQHAEHSGGYNHHGHLDDGYHRSRALHVAIGSAPVASLHLLPCLGAHPLLLHHHHHRPPAGDALEELGGGSTQEVA
ncbi:unnamed protein product [Closterium sp. NIES-54]